MNSNNTQTDVTSSSKPNKVVELIKKHKVKIICISILLLVIILIYIFYKKPLSFNNEFLYEYINSNSPTEIDKQDVLMPKYGTDSTISLNIKIDKYYENYRIWRHIMHKGTQIDTKNIMMYDNWNDISRHVKDQFSGLWLNANLDKLRLCFTTEITSKYKIREHPSANAFPTTYDIRPDNVLDIELEYFDIPEVIVNKKFHICWTINDRNIEVYINGVLRHTFVTQGRILTNNGNFYFNYPVTYFGFIENFRHIPYIISNSEIMRLSKE